MLTHSNPNVEILLNRLEHVSPAGNFYRARCPVHQGKTRDSLKITSCDDGRILLHCHTYQCPPLEILKVCGLELTDLFPERIAHHIAPVECRIWRQAATMRDWQEARNTIQVGKLDALEPRTTTTATTTTKE